MRLVYQMHRRPGRLSAEIVIAYMRAKWTECFAAIA